jgi:hypothetical protein
MNVWVLEGAWCDTGKQVQQMNTSRRWQRLPQQLARWQRRKPLARRAWTPGHGYNHDYALGLTSKHGNMMMMMTGAHKQARFMELSRGYHAMPCHAMLSRGALLLIIYYLLLLIIHLHAIQ